MSNKALIDKSFLLSGKDLKINNAITVKHPTLQEVLDIDKEVNGRFSEQIYYSWVSVFLCDPYDHMVYLDDNKIDYEKIEPFDLFIMMFKDMANKYENLIKPNYSISEYEDICRNNVYFSAFRFFLNIDSFSIAKTIDGESIITDSSNQITLINRDVFSYISEFIKLINGISKHDRINPDDEFAKQILIEDERSRLKKIAKKSPEDRENTDRLGNLISSLTWGGNGGITPFNRNKLHMYDLVDGISRTDKLLNFNHTITGLYSGCVDKKNIDMYKISWQT
jgi:hypothetical protein